MTSSCECQYTPTAQALAKACQEAWRQVTGRLVGGGREGLELHARIDAERARITARVLARWSAGAAGSPEGLAGFSSEQTVIEVFLEEIRRELQQCVLAIRHEAEADLRHARQEMARLLQRLDDFGAALDGLLDRGYYLTVRPWQAANVEIVADTAVARHAKDATWTVVRTPYCLPLSWLFYKLDSLAANVLGEQNKYWFFGTLAEAANTLINSPVQYDVLMLCRHVLARSSFNLVEMETYRIDALQRRLEAYTRLCATMT